MCAATLWPGLQLLVPFDMIGIGNGIGTAMQMLGIGITQIVVGVLQDEAQDSAQLAANASASASASARQQASPSLIPSLCTHFTRAGIEWCR